MYQRGLPPQSTYIFKHALIQDAAYQSLLKSTRQQYHQHIAQVLEAQFPETAEAEPELLAHHYTEAGLIERRSHYWTQAGQRASERSAHVEAISHLRQGLALLQTLPETPERVQREVDMHDCPGSIAAVPRKVTQLLKLDRLTLRAQQLCQHLEDPYRLFPVLRGLWSYYHVRAELQTAHALGEQLLRWRSKSKTLPCSWRRTVPWGRRYSTWARSPLRTRTLHRAWRSTTPSSTVPLCSSMGRTLA